MTLEVHVIGIGLLGPGLPSWAQAQVLLCEPAGWHTAATVVPPPARLPATERRRAGTLVKASLVVADEAVAGVGVGVGVHAGTGVDVATLATVFTSSTGDPLNCHLLCEALALPQRAVSPTRFTNSVHNAPAGYWHIAAASRAPSTSLAAFDASFGAGLLEAAVQCQATQAPVLLVACDVPYPEPLHTLRPLADVFAVALLLAPGGGRLLTLKLDGDAADTTCKHAGLEALRAGIPAARALPLLQALAQGAAARVVLEGAPGLAMQLDLAAA